MTIIITSLGATSVVLLLAAFFLEVTGHNFGAPFWLGFPPAVITSTVAVILGLQQGARQERLASLELREKITCFAVHRSALALSDAHLPSAFNILGDAIAGFQLFDDAPRDVQDDFRTALQPALKEVARNVHAFDDLDREQLEMMAEKLQMEMREDSRRRRRFAHDAQFLEWPVAGSPENDNLSIQAPL